MFVFASRRRVWSLSTNRSVSIRNLFPVDPFPKFVRAASKTEETRANTCRQVNRGYQCLHQFVGSSLLFRFKRILLRICPRPVLRQLRILVFASMDRRTRLIQPGMPSV